MGTSIRVSEKVRDSIMVKKLSYESASDYLSRKLQETADNNADEMAHNLLLNALDSLQKKLREKG